MGLPEWLLAWLQSFLTGRQASLIVDRATMAPVPITAGVPQKSLLLPILFFLFAAPFYAYLRPLKGQLIIGFADNINILAFSRNKPSKV